MNKSSSMVVEIEGKRFGLESADWQNLDCIRIDADTFHLLENGLAHTISIIASDPSSRRYTLKIDGEIKEVTLIDNLDLLIEKMGLNSTKTKKLSVLKAPMPGLVTGIKITAGQEVEKGTPLIILEAMKMEMPIVSPVSGTVKEIKVAAGQEVEADAVLAIIE